MIMTLTPLYPTYFAPSLSLYLAAFPEEERRPEAAWEKLMHQSPLFHADAILDDGDYCGFITSWHFSNFIYVEHFAISSSRRGGGIGGRAFECFMKQCAGKEIVLEVETPDTEIARRRIGFYERHAMHLLPNDYQQPPYRPTGEYFPLRIMRAPFPKPRRLILKKSKKPFIGKFTESSNSTHFPFPSTSPSLDYRTI